jgi:DNA polymerase-3 subunit delta
MSDETDGVLLVWGEDPFLLREAALEALAGLRPREVNASDWSGGELHDLSTPSLFGEPRALLLSDARSLTKSALAELAAYLTSPDPSSRLVVCCTVADRGKPPAALVKLVEPVGRLQQISLQRKDIEPWLSQRAKRLELELTPPSARALVETVGEDAASLVAALEQLAAAFPGKRVTPEHVREQFRGLGEQRTWDLCDKAFGKDLPGAIRSLRSIEEGGDEALMVLGGIASRLRDLIRVRALPDRLPPVQLAKRAGLRFDWQARRYQQQARNFSMGELIRLHDRVTEADRAMKSGGTPDVIMPTLVAAIASGR